MSTLSRDASKTTYRITGIPAKYDTKQVLQPFLREVIDVPGNVPIQVDSLASNIRGDDGYVATVSFHGEMHNLPTGSQTMPREAVVDNELVKIWVDRHFSDWTPLYNPPAGGAIAMDIVFVPGLNSHPVGTFSNTLNGELYIWPRDSLPRHMPNTQILVWGYDTSFETTGSYQTLSHLGMRFHNALQILRPENKVSPRPLILIGYSLGGLVVKSAIKLMKENQYLLKQICHLIFFGVPSQGMEISHLLAFVRDQPMEHFIQSLGRDSEYLKTVHNEFYEVFSLENCSGSKVYSFFELLRSKLVIKRGDRLVEGDEEALLVDQNSATHGRSNEETRYPFVQPIHKTHKQLAKFEPSSGDLDTVIRILQSLVQGASAMIKRRFPTSNERFARQLFDSLSPQMPLLTDSKHYWKRLTVEAMMVYQKIYDKIRDEEGLVSYADLDALIDPVDQTLRDLRSTWLRIKPLGRHNTNDTTPPPLNGALCQALLFVLHMERAGTSLPPDDVDSQTTALRPGRLATLARFDHWIDCTCRPNCDVQWNFVNETGLTRTQPLSAGAEPGSRARACLARKYLEAPGLYEQKLKNTLKLWRTFEGEKPYKRNCDAWIGKPIR